MTPFDFHIQTAQGFLTLGLWLDAHEELERIEPEMRHLSEVLALKVPIFRQLAKWRLLEVVSKELAIRHDDEPEWLLALAEAARHERSMQEGLEILVQAAMRFPAEARIFYMLAGYQARLGYLDAARGRLADAVRIDPGLRVKALTDPDLAPLFRVE